MNVGEAGHQRPEFLRLPKNGTRCPVTGLSRASMNDLILPTKANGYRPTVKSVSLRKRGAVRGVRLIPTDEILSYLKAQLESQNKEGN
ncbi:hypothetical protein Ga0100231_008130 [Opitutaceae bacterium TAV4]|nr:hypothetical protein Ga0100231_008130 [Opitutaceae bacterium TAV4]RRK01008.1 hypothetical protein Ga0100230_008430 [Opitutaceae bacterium TAV3]